MSSKKQEELDMQLYALYWKKLQQSKFDLEYYGLHFNSCTTITRMIKCIVIGATSLATGAWINWNEINYVGIACAIIIWILQGFSALSELLPYEGRKLELREMNSELDPLYNQMEDDWRKIQSRKMTNKQINDLILQYDQKQADIKKHYFKNDSLPEKEKIRAKADTSTEEYFKYFYEAER